MKKTVLKNFVIFAGKLPIFQKTYFEELLETDASGFLK